MGYRVAVVGATGNVGREMLNILAERQFPADEVVALASRKSLGTEVSYGDTTLKTKDLDTFDFTGFDIALFAIGSGPTKTYAPKAAKAGCVVIDNTSRYRYDDDIPLVVPEVNPHAIAQPLRLFHVMRRVDHRAPVVLQTLDHLIQAVPRLRIHPRRGLIQQQRLRIVQHRARQIQPTLHPARVRPRPIARPIRQRHERQQLVAPIRQPFPAQPVQLPEEPQVLPRRQLVVDRHRLRRQ